MRGLMVLLMERGGGGGGGLASFHNVRGRRDGRPMLLAADRMGGGWGTLMSGEEEKLPIC